MKRPYIKKFGIFSGFTIWIVDGTYIRENINEEFTNFGQHYRFRFIPKHEFWIDEEYGNEKEEDYYIDHMLNENRLMKKGMSYPKALSYADSVEKAERRKYEIIEKNRKMLKSRREIIKKVHKKLLRYYTKNIKIWLVKGNIVRDLFFIDFTEGGHDKVYKFIPKNEIWIDDAVNPNERDFIILHELHERNLMIIKYDYRKAHRSASKIEYYCRHYPKEIKKRIKIEILKGKK